MGVFFIHILKSSVCLALFYLCYRILLSKETFHQFNRMALLSIMVLSFLLPFIEVTLPKVSEIPQPFLLLEEAMEKFETKHHNVLTETPSRFSLERLDVSDLRIRHPFLPPSSCLVDGTDALLAPHLP